MKLAILSRSPRAYSTARLREAALARGHKVKILDTLKFSIEVEQESPHLFYASKPLSYYDAVIPRIGASITYFRYIRRSAVRTTRRLHTQFCERHRKLS